VNIHTLQPPESMLERLCQMRFCKLRLFIISSFHWCLLPSNIDAGGAGGLQQNVLFVMSDFFYQSPESHTAVLGIHKGSTVSKQVVVSLSLFVCVCVSIPQAWTMAALSVIILHSLLQVHCMARLWRLSHGHLQGFG
jgi:hypothetical protein